MSRSLSALLFGVLAAAISCASYTAQPATLLRLQSATISGESRGFAVGVSPHLDSERNKQVFQADLQQAGILPLQIIIRNDGHETLEVRKNDFVLQLADGMELAPAPSDVIASSLERSAGVVGWTLAFGLVGYLGSSTQQAEADNARRADLRNKELQDRVLKPQESAQGFIFFLVPAGVREIAQATLSGKATARNASGEISLSLPLRELGAWHEPNRSDRQQGR